MALLQSYPSPFLYDDYNYDPYTKLTRISKTETSISAPCMKFGSDSSKGRNELYLMPTEIRAKIWALLDYATQLQLRLTCKLFKRDIDQCVGLMFNIDYFYEPEQLFFLPTVLIRSCLVEDLSVFKMHTDLHRFLGPSTNYLRTLEIVRVGVIPFKDILTMVRQCKFLRTLKIDYTKYPFSAKSVNHVRYAYGEFSKKLLDNLRKTSWLERITVQIPSSHMSSMDAVLSRTLRKPNPPRFFPSDTDFPRRLVYIKIILAETNTESLYWWRDFLECQTRLKTLICNFGPLYWEYYVTIVQANERTLEKIAFHNVSGTNRMELHTEAFDWSMFSKCENLISVKITCNENDVPLDDQEFLDSVNLDMINGSNLEEIHCRHILLNHLENLKLDEVAPKLRVTCLDCISSEDEHGEFDMREALNLIMDPTEAQKLLVWAGLFFSMFITSVFKLSPATQSACIFIYVIAFMIL